MNNKNNEISFMVCEPDPTYDPGSESYLRGTADFDENDFKPSYHFMHLVKSDPFYCLMLVLDSSALEDLQTGWGEWVHCTVCSEYSAFSEEADRRYLLRFAAHLHLLMDALHCVLDQWSKMKKKRTAAFARNVIYRYLAEKKEAIPYLIEFTSKYPEQKARIYLWSVLDCVLGHGDSFNIPRKNILFDYESLLCMLRAPYAMIRLYPALFGIETTDAN
ncbi:hypothetical protein [Niabella drilacis]|uniref:Uncharacterized protein n=1 Tax=Niabella drilacis (strain DSM 25811 / CCM 8410 / CCUG 62505 / LMG 26954 / E90) TaxID=1285928 RepID=A0A1G6VRW6_NIADE|nr:hypothetical protein [Niabella drilacis]SDD56153.1 hypothetical protein SAMN04487894_110124 [Niabella drilacis]